MLQINIEVLTFQINTWQTCPLICMLLLEAESTYCNTAVTLIKQSNICIGQKLMKKKLYHGVLSNILHWGRMMVLLHRYVKNSSFNSSYDRNFLTELCFIVSELLLFRSLYLYRFKLIQGYRCGKIFNLCVLWISRYSRNFECDFLKSNLVENWHTLFFQGVLLKHRYYIG